MAGWLSVDRIVVLVACFVCRAIGFSSQPKTTWWSDVQNQDFVSNIKRPCQANFVPPDRQDTGHPITNRNSHQHWMRAARSLLCSSISFHLYETRFVDNISTVTGTFLSSALEAGNLFLNKWEWKWHSHDRFASKVHKLGTEVDFALFLWTNFLFCIRQSDRRLSSADFHSFSIDQLHQENGRLEFPHVHILEVIFACKYWSAISSVVSSHQQFLGRCDSTEDVFISGPGQESVCRPRGHRTRKTTLWIIAWLSLPFCADDEIFSSDVKENLLSVFVANEVDETIVRD